MIDPTGWDVYLVTDRVLARDRSTLEIVEAAVAGGVTAVQMREKALSTREFYEQALALRDFLKPLGVPLIINDRVDVAVAVDADGVHLGRSDMPTDAARRILGPGKIIGLSVEAQDHLTEESVEHVDYLGVSPIYLTPTKSELVQAWGVDGLRRARAATPLPLVAIGSITAHNAAEVIRAGANAVAVVSAIVAADDVEAAARAIKAAALEGRADTSHARLK